MESIPSQITSIIDIKRTLTPSKISETLKTLGYFKEFISLAKMNCLTVKKRALDKKVIEKYSKRPLIEFHRDRCKIGFYYCSTRNKSVLSEYIELVTENNQKGIALPVYFTFTPHTLTKKEQITLAEPVRVTTSQVKGKRASGVLMLLVVISAFIGCVPLCFDNNYEQKELIRYYQQNNWQFIGHGNPEIIVIYDSNSRSNTMISRLKL